MAPTGLTLLPRTRLPRHECRGSRQPHERIFDCSSLAELPRRNAAAAFVQGRATQCLLVLVPSVAPESRCFSKVHIAYLLRLDTAMDFWSIVSSWRAAHCSRHSECLILQSLPPALIRSPFPL